MFCTEKSCSIKIVKNHLNILSVFTYTCVYINVFEKSDICLCVIIVTICSNGSDQVFALCIYV